MEITINCPKCGINKIINAFPVQLPIWDYEKGEPSIKFEEVVLVKCIECSTVVGVYKK
ncbi:MAG: hypothetical protein WC430_03775 [Patescibacteria group bacterium]